MQAYHKPVLLDETLALLEPKVGGVYVDATLGGGGHASEILKRIGPRGRCVAIDRDPEALDHAGERLAEYSERLILVRGSFADLASILDSAGVELIDGILFDLGVSSHQLDASRGFSFQRDEELDMRMAPADGGPSAKDVVNTYGESDLADLIWRYGEERYSRRVARAIVRKRSQGVIGTTKELADVVASAIGSKYRGQDIHPATRTFQAIRIEVNEELEAIERALPVAIRRLRCGGRVCVISFHSLEDRIVKSVFRRFAGKCECPPKLPVCTCGAEKLVEVLTKKPVAPSGDEIRDNPRARSSKLRCAKRI